MGGWQSFVNWIMGGKKTDGAAFEVTGPDMTSGQEAVLNIKMLMMRSAIGYLAAGLSLCEWRVFEQGREAKAEEYFRLNNHPNPNQNKYQFCTQYVTSLLVDNEVVVFSPLARSCDLYIADSFSRIPQGLMPDLFQNIAVEGWDKVYDTTADDVIYTTAQFQGGIWPLVSEIAEEYEQIISTAYSGYKTQAGEKGVLTIASAAAGTSAAQDAENARVKALFKSYFANANAVVPLHSGYSYQATARSHRNTSEINDMINLTDEFAERVSVATRVPSCLLKGNAENTEHAMADLIAYGVRPVAEAFAQEYNAKRIGLSRLCRGDRLYIDPTRPLLTTPAAVADYCTKMVANGQHSVDELRSLRSLAPLGTKEAKMHYMAMTNGALGQQASEAGKEIN